MKPFNRNKKSSLKRNDNLVEDMTINISKNFKETLEPIIGLKIFSKFFKDLSINAKITEEEIIEIDNAINKHLDIFFENLCKELNLAKEVNGIELGNETIKIVAKENIKTNDGLQSFNEKIRIIGGKNE